MQWYKDKKNVWIESVAIKEVHFVEMHSHIIPVHVWAEKWKLKNDKNIL
jgi:hypothetical protein